MLQYIRNNQMNLFCHAQVRVEVLLGALAGLTLTWRQIGRVLRSVFLLACCCREAEASAVSHFHDGNHTHFPTELLRKMLQQNRALPRSCIKAGAAFSTLLTRRGRRPGRLFTLNFKVRAEFDNLFGICKKLVRHQHHLDPCGWGWTVGSHNNKSEKFILRTIKKSKTSAQWTAQLLWIVAIIFDLLFLEGIFSLQVPLVMLSLYSRQGMLQLFEEEKNVESKHCHLLTAMFGPQIKQCCLEPQSWMRSPILPWRRADFLDLNFQNSESTLAGLVEVVVGGHPAVP